MTTSALWVTAEEIARLLNVPVGTVHRWAHEDEWPRRRLKTGRKVYPMDKAQTAYDERGRKRRNARLGVSA